MGSSSSPSSCGVLIVATVVFFLVILSITYYGFANRATLFEPTMVRSDGKDHSLGVHWAVDKGGTTTVHLDSYLCGQDWVEALGRARKVWNRNQNVLYIKVHYFDCNSDSTFEKGRIRVINRDYGERDWCGRAIWHTTDDITTEVLVKINDWCVHDEDEFWNVDWFRQYILCHEIGHAIGLDHEYLTHESCMGDYDDLDRETITPSYLDYGVLRRVYGQ